LFENTLRTSYADLTGSSVTYDPLLFTIPITSPLLLAPPLSNTIIAVHGVFDEIFISRFGGVTSGISMAHSLSETAAVLCRLLRKKYCTTDIEA
jgi:hypothetical protein